MRGPGARVRFHDAEHTGEGGAEPNPLESEALTVLLSCQRASRAFFLSRGHQEQHSREVGIMSNAPSTSASNLSMLMKVVVTRSAGFIGYADAGRRLERTRESLASTM